MASFCDQPIDKLRVDTDRDFYMTPNEALAYGLIDEVIKTKVVVPDPKIPMLKVPPPLSIYDLSDYKTKTEPTEQGLGKPFGA